MPADVKIFAEQIEREAVNQVDSLAGLPVFEGSRVRVMPDAHAGKGCVIGFTTSRTADGSVPAIPNVVGVDVGCGVYARRIGETLTHELLTRLDVAAHEAVPSGRSAHETAQISPAELDAYTCAPAFHDRTHLLASMGTLGGGNHFIELDEAPDESLWLVVHTGSRGIGTQLAAYWQHVAAGSLRGGEDQARREELIARLKAEGRAREIQQALRSMKRVAPPAPDDQAWLTGVDRDGYLHDMGLAQGFAARNRRRIAELVARSAGVRLTDDEVESVHNYIDLERGFVRKGAITAYDGEPVIVPLNMAEGCVIGTGRGNEDWNFSAPHGAGRTMSRTAARRGLSMDEYRSRMEGIYSTSVTAATLDEAPMAYKDASSIVEQLSPTVSVEFVMRPVWNFKAQE